MEAAVDTKDKPLPYGASRWDKLPIELRRMVLSFAGHLTRFLCGHLGDPDSLTKAAVRAIWRGAIKLDWQGDLQQLPSIELNTGLSGKGDMYLVRSRSMYNRLCARFPESCSLKAADWIALNRYRLAHDEDDEVVEDVRARNKELNARIFRSLMHIPMRNGWLDLIDFSYPIAMGRIAIESGHVDLLRHLVQHHGVDLKQYQTAWSYFVKGYVGAIDAAASVGSLDLIKMLHAAGNNRCSTWAMDWAAYDGRLDDIKWLHANRDEGCTVGAMDCAAENGHLEVVQWLHENRTEGCTTDAIDSAAANGHLHVVKWLHANRTEGCTTDAMDGAATYGHLATLIWLHENRREGCTTDALANAIQMEQSHIVDWLKTTHNVLTHPAAADDDAGIEADGDGDEDDDEDDDDDNLEE